MQKYQDSVIDLKGNAVEAAAVQVTTYPAGVDATLYSDSAGVTEITNPVTTDENGFFSFYAANGHYTLVITTNEDTKTINDVMLDDSAPLEGSLSWNPGSLVDAAGETSSAITVTGAALGDLVQVSAPYDMQGLIAVGYVSAANTVKIRLQNESGSTVNLASGTWLVRVRKQ